ncbi:protein tyrosine kinase 2 Fak [Dermatophagoides pteronyssinus]|uniref:protein tyrosine kinase 2 Fak n=1 Tax=Dermatophagoides pteronyssinus TaxID=6956 RepID=UPI003F67250B
MSMSVEKQQSSSSLLSSPKPPSLLNKIETNINHKLQQPSSVSPSSSSSSTKVSLQYLQQQQHRYHCRCNVCLSSSSSSHSTSNIVDGGDGGLNNLLSPSTTKTSKNPIDIIREEDENENEESFEHHQQEEVGEDSNDKMFLSQKEPIRPLRFRQNLNNNNNQNNKQTDRIEPFQKPDDLKSFWKEPTTKQTSKSINNEKEINGNDDNGDNGDDDDAMTKVLLRRDSQQQHVSQSSSTNFIRSNNLRSSCPPTSNRRYRHKSVTIDDNKMMKMSSRSNQISSSFELNDSNDRNSFVDTIQHKFNNVVRKSWLSSFFHSFNSKEKQSKWKKSNDFQAEFFDRQNDLMTESLLNRRSPLDLNQCNNERKNQQMSPILTSTKTNKTTVESKQQFSNPNSNSNSNSDNKVNSNWIENSIHEPKQQQQPSLSFIRPNHSSGLIRKKPRPRSACLDNTYMLRMRNGNFIEYNLDSESKDESCSIISSHQHLATSGTYLANGTDYLSSSSRLTNDNDNDNVFDNKHLTNAANINDNHSHKIDYINIRYSENLSLSPKSSSNQRNFNSNAQQITIFDSKNYKQQSSPISSLNTDSIKSNSMISSTASSSSPFLTKPLFMTTTVTPTTNTTTTSSSLSSSSVLMSFKQQQQPHHHHHHQHQQHSFSTKTSYSSSNDPNQLIMECPVYVKIYWPVKNCTEIEIYPEHSAFDVINCILTSQIYSPTNLNLSTTTTAPSSASQWSFALRLICRNLNPNDQIWIHPSKNMLEFLDQNQMQFEKGYKLELRMRYIPSNLEEFYRNDFLSFKFLYNQVLEEFLELELSTTKLLTNQDLILELGSYEIIRSHPYLTPQALEKNSNWDVLENDFHRIFPISFTNSIKPKQLRKLVKSKYKKIYQLNQEQIAFNFMSQVIHLIDFNREVFHCSLGESIWCVPVDLMIGPNIGIAYFTSNSSPPTFIVKSFDFVEQINIKSYSTMNKMTDHSNGDDSIGTGSKKILLILRIKNEDDVLVLTCPSFSIAQSIADLIDGYHRLATNNRESIWLNILSETTNRKFQHVYSDEQNFEKNSLRSNSSAIIEPKKAQFDLISPYPHDTFESRCIKDEKDAHEYDDYSNPIEAGLEIQREHLQIDELLGNGHFGNVHKGIYKKLDGKSGDEKNIAVAIKISRVQNNDNSALSKNDIQMIDQKLLCEAERMHKLDHRNIIKLIGVCSTSPVYVVMELAEYGELRNFLLKNGSQLEHRRLLEYSYQISSAMTFLESKQFVHRDIAARNVLVFSFDCVKLADFGLSRYIEDASYYMATNSKLPIKWMAPESINFRRFTTASDVWMFGVCVWEIFMLGKKPFPGVRNPDVIGLIECGDRLSKPSRCPEQLYELLLKCWRYEPDRRPSFRLIKRKIYDIYQNELGLIGAIARADIVNDLSDSKTSLSSASSGKEHSSSSSSSFSRMHLSNTKIVNNKETNLSSSASQSSVLHPNKIKEILDEQRKQMQEDQKWLQQHEFKWQLNQTDDVFPRSHFDKDGGSSLSTSEHNSTTPSIYEDAHSDKTADQIQSPLMQRLSVQQVYSVPNLQLKSRFGDESYNSYKSTKSSLEHDDQSDDPSTSSLDSSTNNTIEDCGLSVSLKKFFKHNQLTNAKVRNEMMKKVNCFSADVDRKEDPVYWGTINVVNSVRYLLKGVQELNTTEYIDLVKNVGQELRNLLANVDIFLEAIPDDEHRLITLAQKKLSTDMNDLVESMKKAIMYSETPMEAAYKQNMLEASYILVIDSKNLMDTVDEIRLRIKTD